MSTTHAQGVSPNVREGEGFASILFADPDAAPEEIEDQDCLGDLHLDQIIAAATKGRDEYELQSFYRRPLRDHDQARYRQDVVEDLQRGPVREVVDAFAAQMQLMRRYRRAAEQTRHGLQRRRWFLESAIVYCEATQTLADALERVEPQSAGLTGFAGYLRRLVESDPFTTLASDAKQVREAVSDVRYTINIKGDHVQVDTFQDESELAPQVQETFERFAQHDPKKYRWRFKELPGLNHVEAQVLDRVARLFPEQFGRLREFCRRHASDLDETVLRFDREIQFYLGYLEFVEELAEHGVRFCRAELGEREHTAAQDGCDLSLAAKLADESHAPVTNGFRLDAPERVLVVTGPNQGGKTTFARMFGQLHYLAALGLPVPAARASLALPDRVFTHFEREESLQTLRGKFEDELVRIHAILETATERSVLVMNESFGSTTLADGRLVGTEIIRRIIALGARCVFVSFIDEFAAIGPETVSMMSMVEPDDPAKRTFKIERKPADGLAYAAALAAKYRLGYDELRRRIGS
jgi:DNA mismatch repair protein MutS